MRVLILVVLALVACGDNTHLRPDASIDAMPDAYRPHTWGDAVEVWAESWCSLELRCAPDLYAKQFANDAACIAFITDSNCLPNGGKDCTALFSNDWSLIVQCKADMAVTDCNRQQAPGSCYEAFVP